MRAVFIRLVLRGPFLVVLCRFQRFWVDGRWPFDGLRLGLFLQGLLHRFCKDVRLLLNWRIQAADGTQMRDVFVGLALRRPVVVILGGRWRRGVRVVAAFAQPARYIIKWVVRTYV